MKQSSFGRPCSPQSLRLLESVRLLGSAGSSVLLVIARARVLIARALAHPASCDRADQVRPHVHVLGVARARPGSRHAQGTITLAIVCCFQLFSFGGGAPMTPIFLNMFREFVY